MIRVQNLEVTDHHDGVAIFFGELGLIATVSKTLQCYKVVVKSNVHNYPVVGQAVASRSASCTIKVLFDLIFKFMPSVEKGEHF